VVWLAGRSSPVVGWVLVGWVGSSRSLLDCNGCQIGSFFHIGWDLRSRFTFDSLWVIPWHCIAATQIGIYDLGLPRPMLGFSDIRTARAGSSRLPWLRSRLSIHSLHCTSRLGSLV
jgi:hypothetical protein